MAKQIRATQHFRAGSVASVLAAGLLLTVSAAFTSASAVDCQKDFAQLVEARQAIISRINGFQKRKPSAQQACGAFNQLAASEARTLKWVSANQAWCQIPDDVPNGLKQSGEQVSKVRAQACGAASQQAKQIAKLRALQAQQVRQAQGGGGPAAQPGSGVRLPQGAL